MDVVVACECSGIVRDAFIQRGHTAVSVDLLDTERTGPHHVGDVLDYLASRPAPDLLIAHPPCTHLATSGARWMSEKQADGRQAAALDFVRELMRLDIPRIAIENPVSIISTQIRPPDQIVHPWEYGHGEAKTTCLWLKNLPPLRPTKYRYGRDQRIWRMAPGPDRARERSRTFQGIADAMADQWGRRATDVQQELF
jgi:site-specific DNA-cytosine methylase